MRWGQALDEGRNCETMLPFTGIMAALEIDKEDGSESLLGAYYLQSWAAVRVRCDGIASMQSLVLSFVALLRGAVASTDTYGGPWLEVWSALECSEVPYLQPDSTAPNRSSLGPECSSHPPCIGHVPVTSRKDIFKHSAPHPWPTVLVYSVHQREQQASPGASPR